MGHTHLAYPDLALDNFSGTDPDQDAESYIQLIERKIVFALGDAPGDADELANYTFWKNALFWLYFEDPQPNVTRTTLSIPLLGKMFEQFSSLEFQTDETNFDAQCKWNIVSEEMEKNSKTFYTVSKESLT